MDKYPLPLIPEPWQRQAAVLVVVLAVSAVGAVASRMAGLALGMPLAAMMALLAGGEIERRWR